MKKLKGSYYIKFDKYDKDNVTLTDVFCVKIKGVDYDTYSPFNVVCKLYEEGIFHLVSEDVLDSILNNDNIKLDKLLNVFTNALKQQYNIPNEIFKTLTSNKRFLDLVIKRGDKEVLDRLKNKGVINERKRVF